LDPVWNFRYCHNLVRKYTW